MGYTSMAKKISQLLKKGDVINLDKIKTGRQRILVDQLDTEAGLGFDVLPNKTTVIKMISRSKNDYIIALKASHN
tara:strand:- start:215 stop:439 length:225 start_codon:yes stop_codon:yes gene_type:complete